METRAEKLCPCLIGFDNIVYPKETLNKARLTALHAICVQIFRHIAQKSLAIHPVCLRNFYAICRKI
jgi:hypothetical protein